jgi:tetraprenyl-beta-curcumene synthase
VPRDPASRGLKGRLALARAFAAAALRYWLTVFPLVARQLRLLRRDAFAIPDPRLRAVALAALAKRGNIEGAAAFATLAPWDMRSEVVRALVAFQAAYNYADALAEQPCPEPLANARCLHEALLVALEPSAADGHRDYYAHNPEHDDGGYLRGMLEQCRLALSLLPSYALVAAEARDAAERIVAFQSLTLARDRAECEALERWACAQTPSGARLYWWEAAAACGSSLAVHALIAAAADPSLQAAEVMPLADAYFPWSCALHSLLDSLLDVAEDQRAGQLSLITCYRSPREAASRLGGIAAQAGRRTATLRDGARHRVILAGMAAFYLSDPAARTPADRDLAGRVRNALGPPMGAALAVFAARRLASRLAWAPRRLRALAASEDAGLRACPPEDLDARAA